MRDRILFQSITYLRGEKSMTNKKKGIIIAMVSILVIAAVGCGLYFGLGLGKSKPVDSKIAEGELYRTKTESFWVGVGKAYMSFQHKEEPENKSADDKELYGDVFYVMVSSGDSFDSWLSGYYNLDEENGKLTLKAEWDETAENQTKLADAQSGVEKVYVAENEEYKISVELPGSATVTFILNPKTDKVGSITNPPAEEDDKTENNSSDANTDEKAESNGTLFARLTAQDLLFDNSVKGFAQIDMNKDGSWTMKVKVEPYVPNYVQAVNGKWSENTDGSVTLNVTGGDYKDSLDKTFTFKKGSGGAYTGTVKFAADKASGIIFNFNFKSVDANTNPAASSKPSSSASNSKPAEENTSKPAAVATGEIYRTPVYHGIYARVVGDTYISFLDVDTVHSEINLKGKIFGVYVDTGDGYTPWITGYWELNDDNTKLTLTQNGSGDAGLTDAQADVGKEYTAKNGVFTINAYFPSGGTAKYTLDLSRDKVGSTGSTDSKPDTSDNSQNTSTVKDDIVLTAKDSIYDGTVTCDATITVKKDGTWNMTTTVNGNTIENAATGTWIENKDKSLTLNVENAVQGAELPESFNLNYNIFTRRYSGTVNLNCNSQFEFSLDFKSDRIKITDIIGAILDKQALERIIDKTAAL